MTIMQLQDICVSLSLAKQLREAGYPQETEFWYTPHVSSYAQIMGEKPHNMVVVLKSSMIIQDEKLFREHSVAAPTAAEILEKLPRCYGLYSTPWNGKQKYRCHFIHGYAVDYNLMKNEPAFEDETPSNALAKMYLYLI